MPRASRYKKGDPAQYTNHPRLKASNSAPIMAPFLKKNFQDLDPRQLYRFYARFKKTEKDNNSLTTFNQAVKDDLTFIYFCICLYAVNKRLGINPVDGLGLLKDDDAKRLEKLLTKPELQRIINMQFDDRRDKLDFKDVFREYVTEYSTPKKPQGNKTSTQNTTKTQQTQTGQRNQQTSAQDQAGRARTQNNFTSQSQSTRSRSQATSNQDPQESSRFRNIANNLPFYLKASLPVLPGLMLLIPSLHHLFSSTNLESNKADTSNTLDTGEINKVPKKVLHLPNKQRRISFNLQDNPKLCKSATALINKIRPSGKSVNQIDAIDIIIKPVKDYILSTSKLSYIFYPHEGEAITVPGEATMYYKKFGNKYIFHFLADNRIDSFESGKSFLQDLEQAYKKNHYAFIEVKPPPSKKTQAQEATKTEVRKEPAKAKLNKPKPSQPQLEPKTHDRETILTRDRLERQAPQLLSLIEDASKIQIANLKLIISKALDRRSRLDLVIEGTDGRTSNYTDCFFDIYFKPNRDRGFSAELNMVINDSVPKDKQELISQYINNLKRSGEIGILLRSL